MDTISSLSKTNSATEIDRAAVMALRHEPLPIGTKGLPASARGLTIEAVKAAGWNLLAGDLPLPVLTLNERALARNVEMMAAYCRHHDVRLAPHGKTTMAPQLFERQINAGCWALTAATPAHLALYRAFGVGRIFYANQLVESSVLRWLANEIRADPSFEFYCLVDSTEGVARMASVLRDEQVRVPIAVLVEVGYAGGRTGCRTIDDVRRVAQAVAVSPSLRLAGIEAFEGTLGPSVTNAVPDLAAEQAADRVIRFLDQVAGTLRALVDAGELDGGGETIVSAGGSAYFDLVVAALSAVRQELPHLKVVLRSGSYIAHDDGFYAATSPMGTRANEGSPQLEAALELWSVVLSRPEPGFVVVGAGKRDLPIDLGLPIPIRTWSEQRGFWTLPAGAAAVRGVSDQHLHLEVDPWSPIDVGDVLSCAISHPCTAFDKWRVIPVVDDELTVVDAVRTYF